MNAVKMSAYTVLRVIDSGDTPKILLRSPIDSNQIDSIN